MVLASLRPGKNFFDVSQRSVSGAHRHSQKALAREQRSVRHAHVPFITRCQRRLASRYCPLPKTARLALPFSCTTTTSKTYSVPPKRFLKKYS
ncbi:hypothetical protein NDU88_004338 [Pleurodeles waltl]|uniref:Uncharacterized protein n=1 Tax=Pleurodeles waltl TaxID=8319 RepID=A0AAV7WA27_PLEWA|nr:hypothetical protein NDU88_004338 [Pleurodeles waltl]